MVKKLVKKSELARVCGVSPAAITKACDGILKRAVVAKQIDMNHPDVLAYIEEKQKVEVSPATGIDSLYEDAVVMCREKNRFTASAIQRGLKVGYNRAVNILEQMTAAGVVPTDKKPKTDGRKTSKHVRGREAAKQVAKKAPPPKPPVAPTPPPTQKPGYGSGKQPHEFPLPDEDLFAMLADDIRQLATWSLEDLIRQFGTDTRLVDWLKSLKEMEILHERKIKNDMSEGELVRRDVIKAGVIDPINASFIRMLSDGAKTIATRTHSLVKSGADVQEVEDMVADQLGSFIKPTKSKIERTLRNA